MATMSEVQLANMALSHLGKDTIETLDEDSPGAKQCKLWFDYSRIQTLEAYDWSFARKRGALAAHSDDPPDQWAYRYQYPADCVAFRRIWNPRGETEDAVPYSLETSDDGSAKTILTDEPVAVGVWTFEQRAPGMYTAHFCLTFSVALAVNCAIKLTSKRSIKGDLIQQFRGLIKIAPAQNANENVDPPPRDTEWIRGRA